MESVAISEQAFSYAQRAAAAQGLSVPAYLEGLIFGADGQDEAVTLSSEQSAKVRKGLNDIREGRTFTADQVREQLQAKHDAWLQAHPH